MAVLEPGMVEYCTLEQDVAQDDFDSGTFVVAVTEATAAPRGMNKELLVNLDSAEVVQVDRKPALDLSCSVAEGWVAAAGEMLGGSALGRRTWRCTWSMDSFIDLINGWHHCLRK